MNIFTVAGQIYHFVPKRINGNNIGLKIPFRGIIRIVVLSDLLTYIAQCYNKRDAYKALSEYRTNKKAS